MSVNLPHVIASTKDYQLTAQLEESQPREPWVITFRFRGAAVSTRLAPCTFESAKRQALILARQHVARMFEGLL
jgi:hypothetical protein